MGDLVRLAAESIREGAHHLTDDQALVKALLPKLRPSSQGIAETVVAELLHRRR